MPPVRQGFQALTITAHGGTLRELKTSCDVCPAYDPKVTPVDERPPFAPFVGIWDTGAQGTVITQKVVDACGLKPVSIFKVQGAYGGITDRPGYMVNLRLPSGVAVFGVTAVLGEMEGVEVLIGMNIITLGDFAITHEKGVTVFSFRIPSLHTIDYVKVSNQLTAAAAARGAPGGGRVNPAHRKGRR